MLVHKYMTLLRCTYHVATFDYSDLREGDRAVGIGEKPYYDPNSKSRREELGIIDPFAMPMKV